MPRGCHRTGIPCFGGIAGSLAGFAKGTFFSFLLAFAAALMLGFFVYRRSALIGERADGDD